MEIMHRDVYSSQRSIFLRRHFTCLSFQVIISNHKMMLVKKTFDVNPPKAKSWTREHISARIGLDCLVTAQFVTP